jgi:acyl-CoA synthetase (AMP-forming)/AMP-acid ligase II
MYLTQGLRRARQIRPAGFSTVFHDRRRTWAETVERVARVAGGLKALGVRSGDCVALLALNSDRYYELLYAIPWLGAVMVPVNTRLAAPEVAYILEDSGARALFVDGATQAHAAALAGTIPAVKAIVYLDDDEPPAGLRRYEDLAGAPVTQDAGAGGDTLAGLFYTGGTTGKSKGVMLSHNNLVWNAMNAVAGVFFDSDTIYIHSGPMFHLADGASTFGVTACAGRHAFVPRFDPVDCFETIQREKVTHGQYVPTMINMLANHPRVKDYDLSSLKYILYGASPMPEGVLRKALDVLPGRAFIHAYGMTEAAPILTILPQRYTTLASPYAGRIKSCGLAAHTVELKIVDANRREVPRGTSGEVAARADDRDVAGVVRGVGGAEGVGDGRVRGVDERLPIEQEDHRAAAFRGWDLTDEALPWFGIGRVEAVRDAAPHEELADLVGAGEGLAPDHPYQLHARAVGARPVGQELVDEGIEIHLGRRPGRVNVDRMKWLTPTRRGGIHCPTE